MLVALLFLLLILSATMSAAETSLFLVARDRHLMQIERHRRGGGSHILQLLREPNELLMTVLLGNLFVNLMYFAISSVYIFRVKELYSVSASVAASAGVLILLVIGGEILPKTVAAAAPYPVGRLCAPIINRLRLLLAPLNRALSISVDATNRLLGIARQLRPAVDDTLLSQMFSASGRSGHLPVPSAEILASLLRLRRLRLKEFCTPRVDVKAFPLNGTAGEALRYARRWGAHTLPLYHRDHDDIQHYLDVIDLVGRGEETPESVRRYAKPIHFMPELATMDRVLRELLDENIRVILVVDEYGAMAGLATWNDVMRCLQRVRSAPLREGAGLRLPAEIPGRERLRDLRLFEEQPAGDSVTLSGFFTSLLGRVPTAGEDIELGQLTFTVLEASDRQIERMRVERREDA